MMRSIACSVALVFVCAWGPAAWGGQLPERFTLGRYIPADAWLYIHNVHNPERDWLDAKWDRFFEALKASGIDRDVTGMILSVMEDAEDRAEVRATIDTWGERIKAVRWGDLFRQEFVFAERISGPAAEYEYMALARGAAGTAEANFDALADILQALATLDESGEMVRFSREESGGVTFMSLRLGKGCEGSTAKKGVTLQGIELFRRGDVIGLASSKVAAKEMVALMRGAGESASIVDAPRFRKAMGQVKPPEDMLTYFDMKSFLRDISRLMGSVAEQVGPQNEDDGEDVKFVTAIRKALDRCDVMDYVITTKETDGYREFRHEFTRLQPEKRKCALASCCVDRRPFTRFDRYIPKDATGFELTSSVDLEGLYKLAIEFVTEDLPGGDEAIGMWNGILASVGFDPHRDLFSWWSGEMISVTLPAVMVTPMGGGGDWVRMIRVKDEQIASEKVDGALDFVAGLLEAQGQPLIITPADVGVDGFQQVTHPLLAMVLRPVIGVHDNWLIIGSSGSAVSQCLDVAAGRAPSIASSARFRKEGLTPKGPVKAASFTDTSKFGEELGQAIGMIGMFGGMATAAIPGDNEESRQVKQVIQKAMAVAMKLGPVLQKLDFYSSEASVTTYDGKLALRKESVVTYKTNDEARVKTANAD